MPGILQQLKKLEVKESPFENKVLDTKGAVMHWVKPQLVANFEFAAWTKSGRIRKPATFLGFRKDKKPRDVVREVPKNVAVFEEDEKEAINETSGNEQSKKVTGRKTKSKETFVKKRSNRQAKILIGESWKRPNRTKATK